MLIGQSIIAPDDEAGVLYYSPWMPRQGDAFSGVLEVIAAQTGTWTLTMTAETKNNEDSDASITTLSGNAQLTAVGTKEFNTSGALELVRFRFSATGDVGVADKWIHFRTNPPIWQPN